MSEEQLLLGLNLDTAYDYGGMPEYENVKQPDPEITATFKFRNQADYDEFHKVIKEHLYNGEKVFDGMQRLEKKTAWFPLPEKSSKYIYTATNEKHQPRFPIYIVSKGRWKRNPTSRVLKEMNVPFYMVVEEQERDHYLDIVKEDQLLVLPQRYLDDYDRFWQDDDPRSGPGPARNFAWDHSIEAGHAWHWVMDDNLESFERLNRNMKAQCTTGTLFYVCEEFVLRYENIGQAGLNYSIFCPSIDARPPIKLNTRIYSCCLIRNDLPYRWRGRYNEDTDLSLRMMKDGWCTVQFNQFLTGKRATQTMSGGNTAEFYDVEGTKKKSQMLADMHPDVATVVWRINRWHHHVNYKPFRWNRLIKKRGHTFPRGVNNYGMELTTR
jgi:hypothetical protein